MTKNKSVNFLLQMLGCFISAAGIYSFAIASEVPLRCGHLRHSVPPVRIPMGLSNVLINIPIILGTYKLLGNLFLFAVSTAWCCLRCLPTICCRSCRSIRRPPAGHNLRRRGGRHRRRTDLHEQFQHRRPGIHHHGHQGQAPAPAVWQHHLCGGAGGHFLAQRRGFPGCGSIIYGIMFILLCPPSLTR